MKVKVETHAPPPAKPPWRSVVITFETPEDDNMWAAHRNLVREIAKKLGLPRGRATHQYRCSSWKRTEEVRISTVYFRIYRGDAPTEEEKALFKEALRIASTLTEMDLKRAFSSEGLPRLPWS